MDISVAMAVYNGEKYIKEQLDSILNQLDINDELVVSVDKSNDTTNDILSEYSKKYSNILVVPGPCKGVIQNFQNALMHCNNEYIFLCDQDDVWDDNKVKICLNSITKSNKSLLLHDAFIVDGDLNVVFDSFLKTKGNNKTVLKNIIKNNFIGCCMVIKKDLIDKILPLPLNIPMHDQYIGLVSLLNKEVIFIDDKLIKYRRHGLNVSGDNSSSIKNILVWRLQIVSAILKYKFKRK